MLLNFIVENYLSFKSRAELDLMTSSSKKNAENVHILKKFNVLKSVSICGANASGKSNLLKAIYFMKNFVKNSAKVELGDEIIVDSFKLSSETDNQPSIFEATFLIKDFEFKDKISDVIFRYGFELDNQKIHKEWLFARFTAQESKLFTRDGNIIQTGERFKEGALVYKALENINEKSLFLSLIHQLKGVSAQITDSIIQYFSKINEITNIHRHSFYPVTLELLEENLITKKMLNESFKIADLSIDSFNIERKETQKDQFNSEISLNIQTYHAKYDQNREYLDEITFDFRKSESEGTKKFLAIIGPIIHTLQSGSLLVLDEVDSRLHPELIKTIISLFNSKANRKCAQFIFTTHNNSLMDLQRKEQIYFVDKDHYGESELYSLKDFKTRNDVKFSKNYAMGKYGAVPSIRNLEKLIYGDCDGK